MPLTDLFNFVGTSRVAVGRGIETPADVQAVLAAGFTHVLNVRDDKDDKELLAGTGLTYLWNPTDDPLTLTPPPKPTSWFKTSLDFILPVLFAPKGTVLVHCRWGQNRSASTVVAWFMSQGFGKDWSRWQVIIHRHVAIARYSDDAERAVRELGYTS